MKYLVFIVIVVVIWYAMRWAQQTEVSRRLNEERSKDRKAGQSGTNQKRTARAVETIICSHCRAYIPANSPTACDRADCPYPAAGQG